MIICIEGPSAVGKTTLCEALKNEFRSIPEVNLLFNRPKNEPKHWYYKKQLKRMSLCKKETTSTLLDGDPFQPLWYNWIYNQENHEYQLNDAIVFYTKAILAKKISFPDLYIIFNINYSALLARKEKDNSRQRSNFKKHKSLIPNQQRYFKFLKEETNLNIVEITYHSIEQAKQDVLLAIKNLKDYKLIDHTETMLQIATWLKNNEPSVV